MHQELEGLPRKLHELWFHSRVHQKPATPEMPTHQGQTVCEGGLSFAIPQGRHWGPHTAISRDSRVGSGGAPSHEMLPRFSLEPTQRMVVKAELTAAGVLKARGRRLSAAAQTPA